MKLFLVSSGVEEEKCGGCNWPVVCLYLFAKTLEEALKEYDESGGMCGSCIAEMMADNLWETKACIA